MRTLILIFFALIFISCDSMIEKISKEVETSIKPLQEPRENNQEFLISKQKNQNQIFQEARDKENAILLKMLQDFKEHSQSFFNEFSLNNDEIISAAKQFCVLPRNLKWLEESDFLDGKFDAFSDDEITKLINDYKYFVPYYTKCNRKAFGEYLLSLGILENPSEYQKGYYYRKAGNLLRHIAIYKALIINTDFENLLAHRELVSQSKKSLNFR